VRPRALPDVEPDFVCKACGHRGADVRPVFNWNKMPRRAIADDTEE
jgi:hypothetical protein